jgi:Zn-dependent protease
MEHEKSVRWLPPASAPRPLTEPPAGPAAERAGKRPRRGPRIPQRPERGIKRLLYPFVVAAIVLLNWGAKLKGLLLLAPKLKLLTTAGSMLLSVGAYALLWGWWFGLGFVVLLFVHEMGHFVQMRREGVRPSWMVFIPFMGAAVGAKSLGGSALAEARVGLAGPILGTLGCVAVALVGVLTGGEFWYALAFTGFLLNLFNLLPIVPLDGGRAMAAMAPWMWFVGFAGVVVLAFVSPNPVIILIAVVGGFELYRRWRDRRDGEEGNAAYYRVAPRHRLAVGAAYFGLVAALVLGMDLTFVDHSGRF